MLAEATELVVDFPGGGFIAMGPDCHQERLGRWAKRTGKPILSVNYGKSPECEWEAKYTAMIDIRDQIRTLGPSKRASMRIGLSWRRGVGALVFRVGTSVSSLLVTPRELNLCFSFIY